MSWRLQEAAPQSCPPPPTVLRMKHRRCMSSQLRMLLCFRVTSCPGLRYTAIQSDWLCAVPACAFAFAFTVASALAMPLPVSLPVPVPVPIAFANRHRLPITICCLQVLPIPLAFGLLPLLVAGAFCPVGRQLAGSWQGLSQLSCLCNCNHDAGTWGPSACCSII